MSLLGTWGNCFGSESLAWLDISYAGDWSITTLLWLLAGFVNRSNVFERDFSIDDPLIGHPHTNQQISGFMNMILSFIVPACIIVIIPVIQRSPVQVHHGLLGLWTTRTLAHLCTEFLKNRVGRLRPDFLARCKWGEALRQCTGNFDDILDGRRSFPSGHSSTAFSGMTFLFFWLTAKTAAWSFATPLRQRSPLIFASRMCRVSLTLAPLAFALWVAVSRVEDNRHHKEDVIVGSIIGIVCGAIGYVCYWPNPFSHSNQAKGIATQPRLLYRSADEDGLRHINYELTSMEDGREHV